MEEHQSKPLKNISNILGRVDKSGKIVLKVENMVFTSSDDIDKCETTVSVTKGPVMDQAGSFIAIRPMSVTGENHTGNDFAGKQVQSQARVLQKEQSAIEVHVDMSDTRNMTDVNHSSPPFTAQSNEGTLKTELVSSTQLITESSEDVISPSRITEFTHISSIAAVQTESNEENNVIDTVINYTSEAGALMSVQPIALLVETSEQIASSSRTHEFYHSKMTDGLREENDVNHSSGNDFTEIVSEQLDIVQKISPLCKIHGDDFESETVPDREENSGENPIVSTTVANVDMVINDTIDVEETEGNNDVKVPVTDCEVFHFNSDCKAESGSKVESLVDFDNNCNSSRTTITELKVQSPSVDSLCNQTVSTSEILCAYKITSEGNTLLNNGDHEIRECDHKEYYKIAKSLPGSEHEVMFSKSSGRSSNDVINNTSGGNEAAITFETDGNVVDETPHEMIKFTDVKISLEKIESDGETSNDLEIIAHYRKSPTIEKGKSSDRSGRSSNDVINNTSGGNEAAITFETDANVVDETPHEMIKFTDVKISLEKIESDSETSNDLEIIAHYRKTPTIEKGKSSDKLCELKQLKSSAPCEKFSVIPLDDNTSDYTTCQALSTPKQNNIVLSELQKKIDFLDTVEDQNNEFILGNAVDLPVDLLQNDKICSEIRNMTSLKENSVKISETAVDVPVDLLQNAKMCSEIRNMTSLKENSVKISETAVDLPVELLQNAKMCSEIRNMTSLKDNSVNISEICSSEKSEKLVRKIKREESSDLEGVKRVKYDNSNKKLIIEIDFTENKTDNGEQNIRDKEPKKSNFTNFVSNDPKENEDNNNPEWEILKKLETDDERYRAVRQRWRNLIIPDPNKNLTLIHIRSTFKHPDSCQFNQDKRENENIRNSRKRTVSHEPSTSTDHVPVKRARTRSCTSSYESKVQNCYKKMEEKSIKLSQEKRSALANNYNFYNEQRVYLMSSDLKYYNNREFQNRIARLRAQEKQAEEAVHKDFSSAFNRLEYEKQRQTSVLKKALKEVEAFHKFYRQLDVDSSKNDCFFLTDVELEDVTETDKLYERFNTFYS